MLKTSLGKVSTARASSTSTGSTGSSDSGGSSLTGSFQHFTGADGQNVGDGRWRFTLDPVPESVDWIDYDGATLYQDRTPGFSWDGSSSVIVTPPGNAMPGDAQIHVRCAS